MSNTIEITLTDDGWTLIATGRAGFVTNEGVQKLKYLESDALPAPTSNLGHTLEYNVGAYFSFDLIAGQSIYMKSTNGPAFATVTLV